jgi:hypothetical protein
MSENGFDGAVRAIGLASAARLVTAVRFVSAWASVAVIAGGARAEVAWHGFVEGAYGARTSDSRVFEGRQEYTLEETRAQIRMDAQGGRGEVALRVDLLHDELGGGGTDVEAREGYLRFTTLGDHVDIKAGRQALTWGTGDLIFINDLFPKDWVSFFVGRDDPYLKAPADAVRLGVYGLPVDVDIVLTPAFTPDRVPDGSRLAVASPMPGVVRQPARPAGLIENGEVSIRLSRDVGGYALSLYGYRGFHKSPEGIRAGGVPFHPELSVYGASARGDALGSVAWVEGGFYDSRSDRDGSDFGVPNSSVRYLGGVERQIAADFTVGVQFYGESMLHHGAHAAALPPGSPGIDEHYQLLTLRVEKLLHYQTIRLSLFVFASPSDEDTYVRALAGYRLSDDVEVAIGANVFAGREPFTRFARFDQNDNVYARVRYSY